MTGGKKAHGSKKADASEQVRVTDCKTYVDLEQPKAKGFENTDKSIDSIDTTYTHRVAEHYALN